MKHLISSEVVFILFHFVCLSLFIAYAHQ